jgi:hypothetical protein
VNIGKFRGQKFDEKIRDSARGAQIFTGEEKIRTNGANFTKTLVCICCKIACYVYHFEVLADSTASCVLAVQNLKSP